MEKRKILIGEKWKRRNADKWKGVKGERWKIRIVETNERGIEEKY